MQNALVHNVGMLNKVILEPSVDGFSGLRIDKVSLNHLDRTEPGSELHLGSQDLLRLANFAQSQNFKVQSFLIADPYLNPLPIEEQDDVSDDLIHMFQTYGLSEVESALMNEYDGLYIVGVNLVSLATSMRVSIRRRGFVETQQIQETEKLLSSAIQELKLT